MSNWGRKTLAIFGGVVGCVIWDLIKKGLDKTADEVRNGTYKPEIQFDFEKQNCESAPVSQDKDGTTVILRAPQLRELRWMTVGQLQEMFRNGNPFQQFAVENSAEAMREIRWMSQAQVNAIFGGGKVKVV